jgi:hypothetical protein
MNNSYLGSMAMNLKQGSIIATEEIFLSNENRTSLDLIQLSLIDALKNGNKSILPVDTNSITLISIKSSDTMPNMGNKTKLNQNKKILFFFY